MVNITLRQKSGSGTYFATVQKQIDVDLSRDVYMCKFYNVSAGTNYYANVERVGGTNFQEAYYGDVGSGCANTMRVFF